MSIGFVDQCLLGRLVCAEPATAMPAAAVRMPSRKGVVIMPRERVSVAEGQPDMAPTYLDGPQALGSPPASVNN